MAWKTRQTGDIRHSDTCTRIFGRYDSNCPRCRELAAGAPPRAGWTTRKREGGTRFLRELREHDCERAGCGPICTAFDW